MFYKFFYVKQTDVKTEMCEREKNMQYGLRSGELVCCLTAALIYTLYMCRLQMLTFIFMIFGLKVWFLILLIR